MRVTELDKQQLTQLKQDYYILKQYAKNEGVSYGELVVIDTLVTDEEVFHEYQETEFVEDDFWVSATDDSKKGYSDMDAIADLPDDCPKADNEHPDNDFPLEEQDEGFCGFNTDEEERDGKE